MKRLLVLVAGCLMIGLLGVTANVFGQKNANVSPPERREIPGLVEQLKSKDAGARATAAQRLGMAGQVRAKDVAAAVPSFLEMVKSETDAKARANATRALGYSAPDAAKAVPILVEALKEDKEADVKAAAAEALGYLGAGAKDALPALREAVDKAKAAGKEDKEAQRVGKAAGNAIKMIAPRNK